MSLIRSVGLGAYVAIFSFGFGSGCRSTAPSPLVGVENPRPNLTQPQPGGALSPGVAQVAYREPPSEVLPQPAEELDRFASAGELSLAPLIQEVQSRNRSLQAMVAAWQAAAQRYPQVVSLDDPMLGFMVAPNALGQSDLSGGQGYMVSASQKLPWFGKRDLRGETAAAEASAARLDVEDARLRLIETVKLAFFDYYLVHREQELNFQNQRIVEDFRETALAKYRANQVPQQDVLQADVERGEITRRQIELERMRQVAAARINTLLHRAADHALPDPPRALPAPGTLASTDLLQQRAMERRPDLAALGAHERAAEAAADSARQEFYPDVEIAARYDAIGMDEPYRAQVGMNVNIPLYHERRRAALREAQYKVCQRRAEYEARLDEIHNEVQGAAAQVLEARRMMALYHDTILPASEQNVESAKSGYAAGQVDFLRLMDAQRQLVLLREKADEAEVDYHRRSAALERIVGDPLSP
ncbi:MAG TPA: TolC family protein [Pirellulales bacterium]|jgi:outer membrane protein TolC|nr:TolC family protein [Pirellulales bacterium]